MLLLLWVIFALLDPDSGSTDPIESGSGTATLLPGGEKEAEERHESEEENI